MKVRLTIEYETDKSKYTAGAQAEHEGLNLATKLGEGEAVVTVAFPVGPKAKK